MKISDVLLIGFIYLFLLAGVVGHDPWKQDETYSFGIIYHFYTTHSWLVPENAGVPFMEKPPLYYWTAVLFCKMFGRVLALHDAARLASVFYMLVSSLFVWKTAEVMFRNHPQKQDVCLTALLLFLGTIGIVRHAHDMFTDVALLAGVSVALYGMALLVCGNTRWKEAGLWLGSGIGIAFLSKGLFVPVVFGFGFLVLLAAIREMRRHRTLNAVLLAGAAASPFFLIWPALLYRHSHALFMQWFWENNVGRFLGFSVPKLGADNEPLYILYSALWFAFPVFPLALVAVARRWKEWKNQEFLLPVALSVTGLGLLLASASARALYLLPLIPAFTLPAAEELLHLSGKFPGYWNDAVKVLSLIAALLLWCVWGGLLTGYNLPFVAQVFPVDFMPLDSQWPAVVAAIAATAFLLWICFLSHWERRVSLPRTPIAGLRNPVRGAWKVSPPPNPLPEGEGFNAAQVWLAGIATLWIITNTLLLPWIDETKSYRPVLAQMMAYIKNSLYNEYEMNEFNLGESIAPMFEYFSPTHTLHMVNSPAEAKYPLLFMVDTRSAPPLSGWQLVWKGSRALDAKNEQLRLYVRQGNADAQAHP